MCGSGRGCEMLGAEELTSLSASVHDLPYVFFMRHLWYGMKVVSTVGLVGFNLCRRDEYMGVRILKIIPSYFSYNKINLELKLQDVEFIKVVLEGSTSHFCPSLLPPLNLSILSIVQADTLGICGLKGVGVVEGSTRLLSTFCPLL